MVFVMGSIRILECVTILFFSIFETLRDGNAYF